MHPDKARNNPFSSLLQTLPLSPHMRCAMACRSRDCRGKSRQIAIAAYAFGLTSSAEPECETVKLGSCSAGHAWFGLWIARVRRQTKTVPPKRRSRSRQWASCTSPTLAFRAGLPKLEISAATSTTPASQICRVLFTQKTKFCPSLFRQSQRDDDVRPADVIA